MMHVYDDGKVAYILLGILDATNIFNFITNNNSLPGLCFNVKPRISINEQIISFLNEKLDLSKLNIRININQRFREKLKISDKESANLYLATLNNKSNTIQLKEPNTLTNMHKLEPQNLE